MNKINIQLTLVILLGTNRSGDVKDGGSFEFFRLTGSRLLWHEILKQGLR